MVNLELPEGFFIHEEEDFIYLYYKAENEDEPETIASFSSYLENPQVIVDTAESYLKEGN